MGNIFIENENEFDCEKHYYCWQCVKSKQFVQIANNRKYIDMNCKLITGECLVLKECKNINLIKKEVNCSFFSNQSFDFTLLDITPLQGSGKLYTVECAYCSSELGWYCIEEIRHPIFCNLYYIKVSSLF